MEKIYRVQMNRNGAPDFSTAVECEDAVSRTWLKNYCERKAAHYRMRKERIEAQGDAITYYPEKQIEGFKDEIALYEWLAKEIDKAPSAHRPKEMCLKEAEILLKATRNLLNKQNESIYVLINMLAETVTYHGVECDGSCLIEDIDAWLELYGSEEGADDEAN